ncbi:MAG: helix-turn-helix domain-containing protein [Gammaproteobacteria bacterium]|nr:helix-turn-helix domain-containing protein [Gammaproteobacteria bacterium]
MEPILNLRSYAHNPACHSHNFHQLVFPLMGSMDIEVNTQKTVIEKNQIAVIPANVDHTFHIHNDKDMHTNQFMVANIPLDLSPSVSMLPPFINLNLDQGLNHYLYFLENEINSKKRNSFDSGETRKKQIILLFIQLLVDRFSLPERIDKRLVVAHRYMNQRLDQPITVREIALAAHLGERQMTTLFRRSFGMPPKRYLLEQRMQLAWHLLSGTTMSVQQVGDKCGYTSISAFSTRFSQHFGRSPMDIRSP